MAFKIFSSFQPVALTSVVNASWTTRRPHDRTSMIWGGSFLFLWSLPLLKTAQFLMGTSIDNIIIAFQLNGFNPSCSSSWTLLALGLQKLLIKVSGDGLNSFWILIAHLNIHLLFLKVMIQTFIKLDWIWQERLDTFNQKFF